MKTPLSILCVLLLSSTLSFAQYYPKQNWERKSAEEVKMNPMLLDSAVSIASQYENSVNRDLRIAILEGFSREPDFKILGKTKERGGTAGLVVKDGYIVAEWGDIHRVDMTFSVAKSYLSTLAGLALDKELIGSIDDKVFNYVWDGTL